MVKNGFRITILKPIFVAHIPGWFCAVVEKSKNAAQGMEGDLERVGSARRGTEGSACWSGQLLCGKGTRLLLQHLCPLDKRIFLFADILC